MGISPWKCLTTLSIFLVICLQITNVYNLAVMSVDIGSEWMKVSIVSPGVPMEIALNKESKRKTPTAIAFRNGERTFGENALTVCVRFPSNCYIYFLDLLGKKTDNPVVDLYKKRFPYYNIISDPKRNTVIFKHDETDKQFSPEELLAMMLEKAREFAQDSIGQVINEAVITVPGYFGQAERSAMLHAAEIAGIKVLQLINSYTAAALNYGIFHTKSFNETSPMYMMFYDMGAYATQVSIVSYQLVKSKDRIASELQPQLTILGVGYERNLGGLEIQLRLRDYLAKKFNALKLTPNDVTKNARSMAKLFKEAERLKNILSANSDHFAQVEGLIDEKDMRIKVTREELEELCKDLFDKVALPAQRALVASGLTIDLIDQVMLTGAGTRVPRVQDRLVKDLKSNQPLGQSLNTDEAASLGAAYKAADLSNGFKVKPFIIKEATLFPIQITFDKELIDEDKPAKQVKHILFGHMNPYPQRKIITFNKHQQDFNFTVGYAELSQLDENEVKCLGPLSLSVIKLKGVKDAYYKYQEQENVDIKGIKAYFAMDDSGLLVLQNIKLVVEKTISGEEEFTLSKIGNTISNLFKGHNGSEKVLKEEKPAHETPEEGPVPQSDNSTFNSTETFNKTNSTEQVKLNDTILTTDLRQNLKVVIIKETINVNHKHLFVHPPQEDDLRKSINKITKLKEIDLAKAHKESSLNNLITAIIETREKLEQPDYASVATDVESKSILDKCSEISNWLEYGDLDDEADVLDSKFDDLKKIVMPVWERFYEHMERPTKLKALNSAINNSNSFLEKIKNTTLEDTPFTQVEIDTLNKLISEVISWRDKQVEEQEKLPKSVDPVLTVQTITMKHSSIEREMRYLMSKFASWKAKKKEEPKVKTPTLPTDKEKTKIPDEQVNDIVVNTNSQDDEVKKLIIKESSSSIVEDNVDFESKLKTKESKPIFEPPVDPTKTDEKEEDTHTEL